MAYYDTYDRRVQLAASRQRLKDAEHLKKSARWNGAIYLAGYAIECSLKALICSDEYTNNLKDTVLWKKGVQGAALHNLGLLYTAAPQRFRTAIERLDHTNTLKNAWETIIKLWRKDELRYGHKEGNEKECERFFKAVKVLHGLILSQQGEAS